MPKKANLQLLLGVFASQVILPKGQKLALAQRQWLWKTIYDRIRPKGEWQITSAEASAITSVGWLVAMESRDFTYARQLAREFLAHPDATDSNKDFATMSTLEAVADAFCGEVDRACAHLATILRSSGSTPVVHLDMSQYLLKIVKEMPAEEPPRPCVRMLAVDPLGLRNKGFAANRALIVTTNQDLVECLAEALKKPVRTTKN